MTAAHQFNPVPFDPKSYANQRRQTDTKFAALNCCSYLLLLTVALPLDFKPVEALKAYLNRFWSF